MLNGLAQIKLRPVQLTIETPSANAGEQYEVNIDGLAKFSIENQSSAAAYIEFSAGSFSNAMDIPNGEVREFAAPTGGVFYGKIYISWGVSAASTGKALLIKQTPQ